MKNSITRKYTNQLIDLTEQGVLTWEVIARSCLSYMSEYDVEDMVKCEGLVDEDEEEE